MLMPATTHLLMGPSTREADKEQNTDILNALVAKVAEKYGAENAATFGGAAANCLYIMLQLMQKCGSVGSCSCGR